MSSNIDARFRLESRICRFVDILRRFCQITVSCSDWTKTISNSLLGFPNYKIWRFYHLRWVSIFALIWWNLPAVAYCNHRVGQCHGLVRCSMCRTRIADWYTVLHQLCEFWFMGSNLILSIVVRNVLWDWWIWLVGCYEPRSTYHQQSNLQLPKEISTLSTILILHGHISV